MPLQKPTNSTVYQFKVTLRDIKPPIWRRIQVRSETTLGKLHDILQVAMGWFDGHLHVFEIQERRYGRPDPKFDWDVEDASKVKLSQIVTGEKFKFHYIYDMGDGWEHEIVLEKLLPADPETHYPTCIKGKRACPPEDCGGAWGYAEFLAAIQTPTHPEHESMLEWVGGEFDPEEFDIYRINEELEQIGS
ncbi:plasmid pRiA4b ORF-3 family protein [Leptolyngbya boryana CZ1]|uniref:Plasmid pRiA4b ORF-3 family protein n=1 Tax=Leptolyngbya boryana CZ1 TaxID=3060204 RepID=A0AA96WTM1_LEPBY|nr:plasmid pRiA4b ORF-3 family protein [Leptolyngbya boryana]WNZ44054.1 plasmid pRiA4b ORF-3 family protein [Leptolyngbya boryana CZ1]